LPGDAAIVGKLWKSTVNRMNWVKQLKLSSLSLHSKYPAKLLSVTLTTQ